MLSRRISSISLVNSSSILSSCCCHFAVRFCSDSSSTQQQQAGSLKQPPSSSSSSSSSSSPSTRGTSSSSSPEFSSSFRYQAPSRTSPRSIRQEYTRQKQLKNIQNRDNSNNNNLEEDIPDRFPRKQDDAPMYHGLSPENLSYLHEVEEQEQEERSRSNSNNNNSDDLRVGSPFSDGDSIQSMRAHSFIGRGRDISESWRREQGRQKTDANFIYNEEGGATTSLLQKQNQNKNNNVAEKSLAVERKLQLILDSNADDRVKSDAALECCSNEVMRYNLHLRPRFVEEVFGLWSKVSSADLISPPPPPSSSSASSSSSSSRHDNDSNLLHNGAREFLEPMTSLYFHLRKHHAAPTTTCLEHFMSVIQLCCSLEGNGEGEDHNNNDEGNRNIKSPLMQLASRLMLDSDRFTVLCSRITYATYFDICSHHHCMDVAVRRFADAKTNLFLEPDGGMVRSIVAGLAKNGLIEEALAFLARTSEVQVDIVYLNSMLELLLLSEDPMSAFAAFRSLEKSGLVADSVTFCHLLRACEASGQWQAGVPFVLAEMQRLRVKGNDLTLNLLLKGLLLCEGMSGYAHQLYFAMLQKGVPLFFPQVEEALPAKIRQRGEKLSRAVEMRERDRRGKEFSSIDAVLESTKREIGKLEENQKKANNANAVTSASGESKIEEEGDASSSTTAAESDRLENANTSKKKRDKFTRRDIAVEKFLRYLAAHGKLSPSSNPASSSSSSSVSTEPRATISTMCVFCLKRNLGDFDHQDSMQRYLDLKLQLKKSKKVKEQKEEKKRNDEEEDDDVLVNELKSLSRTLKPILWKTVYKHFYGITPVSTRVLTMRKNRLSGGGGGGGDGRKRNSVARL